MDNSQYKAAVIGVSSGGLEALGVLLPMLKAELALTIMIVQHLHPYSDDYMVRSLNEKCHVNVKYAISNETIKSGVIYFAPPNYHLLVEHNYTLSLAVTERVCYARPAVDVLFETAAEVYQNRLIGVVLTGANHDGSAGLRRIKALGGMAIVQEPSTAAVDIMPRAALKATKVDYVLTLTEIGNLLNELG